VSESIEQELARYRQWVQDLQAGMFINCVYCGHMYGPDDEVPASMADVLKEHVEQCPEHPMSALKRSHDALVAEKEKLVEALKHIALTDSHDPKYLKQFAEYVLKHEVSATVSQVAVQSEE
jgi:hypothetical protein